MENQLLSNNVTLAGLRRLLKELRVTADSDEAVNISLNLWSYDNIDGSGRTVEKLGIYHSKGGPTEEFHTLKEAQDYLKELKKQKKGEM